jgi:hypothetical protein
MDLAIPPSRGGPFQSGQPAKYLFPWSALYLFSLILTLATGRHMGGGHGTSCVGRHYNK